MWVEEPTYYLVQRIFADHHLRLVGVPTDAAGLRPDALEALVYESERVDAAIAGSKLIAIEDTTKLLSVGVATDVFDTPYRGLDDGEIDAGQYDVVRDVAAVDVASMLIRRDIARGIGGLDPLLPPGAASIDVCQRARIVGGRVVVVPSSEVAVARRLRAHLPRLLSSNSQRGRAAARSSESRTWRHDRLPRTSPASRAAGSPRSSPLAAAGLAPNRGCCPASTGALLRELAA